MIYLLNCPLHKEKEYFIDAILFFFRHGSPKSHNRSSSHDSYFERKMSVQFQLDNSELHTSNLDISEIQVLFSKLFYPYNPLDIHLVKLNLRNLKTTKTCIKQGYLKYICYVVIFQLTGCQNTINLSLDVKNLFFLK